MKPNNALMSLAVAGSLVSGSALAQDYSDVELPGTIRVIVAYSAGGSSDALARVTMPIWERYLEELTGQDTSTVVVNLPGAGGEIGWAALANADPDGSTVGIINLPAVPVVQEAREPAYAPWLENFTPIGVNVIDPNVVRVGEDSGFDSLEEAVQAAKDDPGSVSVGADGPLSDDHLATYVLAQATGAEFTFIPYAGGAPANRAFASGEVDLAIGNVFDHLQTEDATVDAGVFRPTAYGMIPEVEPVGEKLDIQVRNSGSTRGFAAPEGVSGELLEVYREALRQAFADEDYQQQARERNITLVEPAIGEEFGDIMREQDQIVGDLLQYFIDGGYIE